MQLYFYSHTPHGVQLGACNPLWACTLFLLTHPSRGATIILKYAALRQQFLLTHPLRGATEKYILNFMNHWISTHTPLAGCNEIQWNIRVMRVNFYSHTPCGVQQSRNSTRYHVFYFYSHTPCGVQPQNNVFYCKLHTI